jgi:hypothetical protein
MLTWMMIAAMAVLSVGASVAQACQCPGIHNYRWGCSRDWSQGDVVFLGKVTANVEEQTAQGFGGVAAHFSVTEGFRGDEQAGEDVVVHTRTGGGDCGYPFAAGSGYLVYASGTRNSLYASVCTLTTPEVIARGILRELRAIRERRDTDSLFGVVGMTAAGENGFDGLPKTKPLAGVVVRAIGQGGQVRSATADQHGGYAFGWLPPDLYRIEEDLPPGLNPVVGWSKTPNIDLNGQQETGAGCELAIFAAPEGQISGTVVDGYGKGMPGFLTLNTPDSKIGGLPGDDMDDGRFSLEWLRPGRYRLVFRPKLSGERAGAGPFYWPAGGGWIELGLGQHIENMRFEVGAETKKEH